MEKIYLSDIDADNICSKTVTERLRQQLRLKAEKDEGILPGILSLDRAKRQIQEILISGNALLLKGEFGVGKTEIAKAVFHLLKEYYDENTVYIIEDCPVQENAWHLYDYKVNGNDQAIHHICPICCGRYIVEETAPENIPLSRHIIREGSGLARIQGNEDIEPEKILGMYNIHRLQEVGDPYDPRVLELGKLAQASNGLLFIDELGLVNKEAQYAILQALQEKYFSPMQSRLSFPLDFLFIATTNHINEFQIHPAIKNRMVSLAIPRLDETDELKLISAYATKDFPEIYFPERLLEYLLYVIRFLNETDLYLGPRSSIRSVQLAKGSAFLDRKKMVDYCHVRQSLLTEISGQYEDEDMEAFIARLTNDMPTLKDFFRQKFSSFDSSLNQTDDPAISHPGAYLKQTDQSGQPDNRSSEEKTKANALKREIIFPYLSSFEQRHAQKEEILEIYSEGLDIGNAL